MSGTCLVAMSGGVDSSVALELLTEQGYECQGVMMKLTGAADDSDARRVARQFSVPFTVCDWQEDFDRLVISPFCRSYCRGETPNPCIDCNRTLKFGRLLELAEAQGCSFLATGHYARIRRNEKLGRWELCKAADRAKDQSYVLYSIPREKLAYIRFPLGELTKPEVRAIAERLGLDNAKKKDSQDICFVPDGDYAAFVRRRENTDFPEGSFVDTAGNLLGRHRGIIHYTVGQRRGLGISAEAPLYVAQIRPEDNTVVLGRQESLFTRELTARRINLLFADRLEGELRCKAKIRYHHTEQPCTVTMPEADTLKVVFDEPQRAVTAGQSVVLYDGDTVLGGGIIQRP